MKNRLLLTFLCGAMSAGLMAQSIKDEVQIKEDLTSKIQNADFSQGTPVAVTVQTYDYNMADKGAGAGGTGLFGMQAVPGWTASNLSDNIQQIFKNEEGENEDPEGNVGNAAKRTDQANAKAAGIFAWTKSADEIGPGLGAEPDIDKNSRPDAPIPNGDYTGNALAILGVWGASPSYTQDITLPAGDYLIEVKLINSLGAIAVSKNLIGFIANNGKEYLSTTTAYPITTGDFQNDYIVFRLTEETSGKISLGYKAADKGSGDMPHIFIDKVNLYSIDKSYFDGKELEAAKETLRQLVEEGKDIGLDVSEAEKVLDNPYATIEEIKAAIEKQKQANTDAQTDMSAYFISNPHFTLDEPLPENEGICTYNYDKDANNVHYYGMQPLTNWIASHPTDPSRNNEPKDEARYDGRASGLFNIGSNSFLGTAGILPPKTMSDGSEEGVVLGFLTAWSMSTQYTQNVTLPAGKYTVVLSYYNTSGSMAVSQNLIGFVEGNGTTHYGKTTQFPEGRWTTEKVTFELSESTSGYFSMGYKAGDGGSAAQPHLFIDGFSIYYVGQMDNPSLTILGAAIKSANNAIDNEKFNKEIKAKLQSAVNEAQKLYDANNSNEEENIAAADAINSIMSEVSASIEAYETLIQFVEKQLSEAIHKYGNENVYGELTESLYDLESELNDAYDYGTYTTEQINEAIASFDTMIKEGVKAAWDAAVASGDKLDGDGIDISIFFDQLAYTHSTSAVKNSAIPDKEWNFSDYSESKTQYGTAEVWNQSPFAISRTISGLPAGTYTVTTKAFYRIADNATNYDTYQSYNGKAYVFAGAAKTELTNVAEIVSDEAPAGLGWAAIEGKGLYQPNSQQAAYNTFENAAYTEALQKSAQSVVVNENGDLTFGITADQLEGNSWVVWYTFSISYNAVNEEVLSNELEQLIETAYDYYETYEDDMNQNASDKLYGAIENAEDAGGTIEEMSAAVVALQEALDYAKTNVADLVALDEAMEALNNIAEEYLESASPEAQAEYDSLLDETEETDELTNEEIEALIERAIAAAQWLKVPAYEGASDDTPVDMTQVIENSDFEQNGENGIAVPGWKYTASGVDTNAPKNKATAIDGKSAEFWGSNPVNIKFDFYQKLSGLPAGTYKLSAMAVNAQIDTEDEGYIALYAQAASGAISSTKVDVRENTGDNGSYHNDESEVFADAQEYSVIFTIEDKEEVTIGFKSIGTQSARWFICDNFTLLYYGADSAQEANGDDALVDIDGIGADAVAIESIYTITGAKVSSLQKGINIVKYADGKVAKVLVK